MEPTEPAANLGVESRLVVPPRLRAVTSDARDATIGLRLLDVWRYARLYWSIPHQSTGRNLFYLVRDDAGPGSPVMMRLACA